MTKFLIKHLQFLEEVRGIPITGVMESQMACLMPNSYETTKASMLELPHVLSIEKTRDTIHMGRWIVVIKSLREAAVVQTLNNTSA